MFSARVAGSMAASILENPPRWVDFIAQSVHTDSLEHYFCSFSASKPETTSKSSSVIAVWRV